MWLAWGSAATAPGLLVLVLAVPPSVVVVFGVLTFGAVASVSAAVAGDGSRGAARGSAAGRAVLRVSGQVVVLVLGLGGVMCFSVGWGLAYLAALLLAYPWRGGLAAPRAAATGCHVPAQRTGSGPRDPRGPRDLVSDEDPATLDGLPEADR